MEEGIIYKYLAGETTTEEEKELLAWLMESEENRRIFFELKAIWNIKSDLKGADSQSVRFSLDHLNQRIDECESKQSNSFFRKFLWIGSSVAAIFLITFFLFFNRSIYPEHPSMITLTNTVSDSVMQVTLDDGTSIWLNTNTSLTYPSKFVESERMVHLEGNAFFEVKRDTLHPFIVSTDRCHIRVLGTSFSMNTKNHEDKGETILIEGSVSLEKPNGERIIILHPGQQAVYTNDMNSVEVNKIDARQHALWRFGLVSLSNVSIQEIIQCLEETYGVRIRMNIENFLQHRYSFSFKQSGTPEDALRHLFYLTGEKATILQ